MAPIHLIYSPFPDQHRAKRTICEALNKRYIVCANVMLSNSFYWWQSAIEDPMEYYVLFKTSADKVKIFLKWLEENHPYEAPLIIDMPASVNVAYSKYMKTILKD